MSTYRIILIAVFAVMNLTAFILMGVDKRRATEKKWRIKEATLFLFATLLGGVGATIGMFYFRHKTQHWYFRYGFPLLAVVSVALFIYLFIILA